jgi:hypothetical protein
MAGIRGNGTSVERTEPGDATDADSRVIPMQAALNGATMMIRFLLVPCSARIEPT